MSDHVPGNDPPPRLLCIGECCEHLIRLQLQLDDDYDPVLAASLAEAQTILETEPPFDVVILDANLSVDGWRGFLEALCTHSPQAERIVLTTRFDPETREELARDARVMKVLLAPCPAMILREVVGDAFLRHRARALRAATPPHLQALPWTMLPWRHG